MRSTSAATRWAGQVTPQKKTNMIKLTKIYLWFWNWIEVKSKSFIDSFSLHNTDVDKMQCFIRIRFSPGNPGHHLCCFQYMVGEEGLFHVFIRKHFSPGNPGHRLCCFRYIVGEEGLFHVCPDSNLRSAYFHPVCRHPFEGVTNFVLYGLAANLSSWRIVEAL